MRPILLLAVAATLACATTRPPGSDASAPMTSREALAEPPLVPAVDSLLSAAAADFRQQRSQRPVRFRGVRSGYLVTATGARQYLLCGEYTPASDGAAAEWIPFATIQTSPYEQWLGAQALTWCRQHEVTWDERDLSGTLLDRFTGSR